MAKQAIKTKGDMATATKGAMGTKNTMETKGAKGDLEAMGTKEFQKSPL